MSRDGGNERRNRIILQLREDAWSNVRSEIARLKKIAEEKGNILRLGEDARNGPNYSTYVSEHR